MITPFDRIELGEHVHIVKVNASDPQWVSCNPDEATKIWAVSPHDEVTIQAMNASCPRCGEQLSFVTGRHGETMSRDGVVWGGQQRRGSCNTAAPSTVAHSTACAKCEWSAHLLLIGC